MTEAKTEQRMIKISSSDNETFTVPREVIRLSTTINTLLQDLGFDDNDSNRDADPITFNIKNDFTPEEEEQIRKENAWCED
ncbi:hypothetical protein B9Z55_012577 [Caenorhabditis nigoni]|uniref:SKP1 component POZ domain-containing protein n=1 Tax=Caenorhabditis nigoni TaxID=1611254 RepID=A0A2G5TY07_9PELO|nr:hypothetical protein B9Z55_012577 [Caenorhabditis nigoni]